MTAALLLALVSFSPVANAETPEPFQMKNLESVEFTFPVVFQNPSQFDGNYVTVYGKKTTFTYPPFKDYRLRCHLQVYVKANSKSSVPAARKMEIRSKGCTLELESEVTLGCEEMEISAGFLTERWTEACVTSQDIRDVAKSLPQLKLVMQQPKKPEDKEL